MRINTADVRRSGDTMTGALNLSSTATNGVRLYNTVDEVTNYERVALRYSSNVILLETQKGGSGTLRPIRIGTTDSYYEVNAASTAGSPVFNLAQPTATTASHALMATTFNSSSDTQYGLRITPVISQSGTGAYQALNIAVTESSTGSGTKSLILAQVGGTSRFTVLNTGMTTIASTDASTLILNGTGTANTVFRFQDDGTEIGAMLSLNGSTTLTLRSQADLVLTSTNAGTARSLTLGSTALTFGDTINIAVGTTTGTKIGTATSQKLGFFNATPVVQLAAVTDPTGGATIDAEARTAIIAVIDRLQLIGLMA